MIESHFVFRWTISWVWTPKTWVTWLVLVQTFQSKYTTEELPLCLSRRIRRRWRAKAGTRNGSTETNQIQMYWMGQWWALMRMMVILTPGQTTNALNQRQSPMHHLLVFLLSLLCLNKAISKAYAHLCFWKWIWLNQLLNRPYWFWFWNFGSCY